MVSDEEESGGANTKDPRGPESLPLIPGDKREEKNDTSDLQKLDFTHSLMSDMVHRSSGFISHLHP